MEQAFAPKREEHGRLIARPDDIEDILRAGAKRACVVAMCFMARLRDALSTSVAWPAPAR